MTPLGQYVMRVALPRELARQKQVTLRGKCEDCAAPVKKGTRWCRVCRIITVECAHCGDDFQTERGIKECKYCSVQCSGHARHQPKKTENHKAGMRMRSWGAR